MTKGLACVETKKVDALFYLSYEKKETVATVNRHSPAHKSCCLMFFGITSILVIHSLLDLE